MRNQQSNQPLSFKLIVEQKVFCKNKSKTYYAL